MCKIKTHNNIIKHKCRGKTKLTLKNYINVEEHIVARVVPSTCD